jgi:hypothetical protein
LPRKVKEEKDRYRIDDEVLRGWNEYPEEYPKRNKQQNYSSHEQDDLF